MDYLLEAQRRDSLYSAEEALEKEMQRRRENDDERTCKLLFYVLLFMKKSEFLSFRCSSKGCWFR
jgi:hypothetical protein